MANNGRNIIEQNYGNNRILYIYTDADMFKDVSCALEATSLEKASLIPRIEQLIIDYNVKRNKENKELYTFGYEVGYIDKSSSTIIGTFHNNPISLYLSYFSINGKVIMTYTPSSDIMDLSMVRAWFLEHFKFVDIPHYNNFTVYTFYICVEEILHATFNLMKNKKRKEKIKNILN